MAKYFALPLAIFCLLLTDLSAQSLGSIEKSLLKKDFDKAWRKIDKLLNKDSLNAGAYYYASLFHFKPENPQGVDLPAAHRYAEVALKVLPKQSEKSAKMLEKAYIARPTIAKHKERVDSTAFAIADSVGSVEAYQRFIATYASAAQKAAAIEKRNALAYAAAQRQDTWQAYQRFIKQYPKAWQVSEATERYHLLLYQDKTSGRDLQSYANFIAQYPESPYLQEASLHLYELFTKPHTPRVYFRFLEQYPQNQFADRAWAWLFTLSDNKDSLARVQPALYNKPFVENFRLLQKNEFIGAFNADQGKFGLMDLSGEWQVPANFDDMYPEQLCQLIDQPYAIVQQADFWSAINLLGDTLMPFAFQEVSPFCKGVLRTKKFNQYGLVQAAGFPLIGNEYDMLAYLTPRLVKAKKDGRWGLLSYSGRTVLPFAYEEMHSEDGRIIAIPKNGRFAYTTEEALFKNEEAGKENNLDFAYTDYEISHDDYLILEQDSTYKLQFLESGLQLISNADYISESSAGWTVEENGKYTIYQKDGRRVSPVAYQDVIVGDKGYAVKINEQWGVIDFSGQLFIQPIYDTLYFVADKAILLEKEAEKWGYFYQEDLTDFSDYQNLEIKSAMVSTDSSSQELALIVTTDKRGRKGLLDGTGKTLISNRYNNLIPTENGLIIAERNRKKGLLTLSGKELLPLRYDGLVAAAHQNVAVLQSKAFGLYLTQTEKLIQPEYQALLQPYGPFTDSLFIAKKGQFGIIDNKNKVILDFQFDDLKYWNDSIALVQSGNKWQLFNFKRGYPLGEIFDRFEYLKNTAEEVVIKTYRSSGYGVLSSRYGRTVLEEYSEITNLGTLKEPVYLVEKDISQAGIHVVLYLDKEGKLLKEMVLKDADYMRLPCSK